ncbi:biotin--[acetyl-CoA-carboxylase] ligase [Cohaesibacter sp. CAU 1516]|uniref:biotin--[acetyl-CoA-carboxylase] ligase n=1 Tax=Cohaesibacter sp. CAU 1516 TaxID=2576038 RepID=UPI0010FDB744|nr:biotin--[acetyl-CoA-carboxylase] ligase [Cohaesibacter sp. CAU 1516]TLP49012.1 biotin--[acetyl-CoA-carboxylase] ligase [Cohaesibacter sp. CAU 1516]
MSNIPAAYRHLSFKSIDSTNRYALDAARDGRAGNLWVTAGEQTAGRGRRGRHWSSEQGNLSASLLLIDPAPMKAIGQLPLVAATAVHRAISGMLSPVQRAELTIKWPNDVLWGDQKICGILLETTTLLNGAQAVVIGIGINCRNHPETTEGLAAADLLQYGYDIAPEQVFERLAHHLDERLSVWDGGDGMAEIRDDWLLRARGVGQPVVARLPDEDVHGTFEQLDEQGALIMRLPDGTQRIIYAGDVYWPGAIR